MMNIIEHIKHRIQGKIPAGSARSPKWEHFKAEFEKETPKVCVGCGTTEKVELHHIFPFHKNPAKELDKKNVIWLCETAAECHRRIGHLLNYKGWNPQVRLDAPEFYRKVRANQRRIIQTKTHKEPKL